MKPPRYTGTPIGGGERMEGYYCPNDFVPEFEFEGEFNFVDEHGVMYLVDPATVEPVRMAVKHERTFVGDYRCPVCNVAFIKSMGTAAFIKGSDATPFCGNCGQALEWPEDKEG